MNIFISIYICVVVLWILALILNYIFELRQEIAERQDAEFQNTKVLYKDGQLINQLTKEKYALIKELKAMKRTGKHVRRPRRSR